MRKNILAMEPFSQNPFSKINESIENVLRSNNSDNIQIEFKYAEWKYFCPSNHQESFLKLHPDIQTKALSLHHHIFDQNALHLDTLKKLSHQNLIMLNPLGKRVYRLNSQFDEFTHRRFYHIREFLIKLAKANSNHQTTQMPHIYKEISKKNQNSTIKVTVLDELRLDIILMNSGALDGRYTYSPGFPWKRINKQSLIRQQLDIMMSERLFRLAINDEKESEVSYTDLLEIKNRINNPNCCMVRLKKALRVLKGDEVEISLSEVYEPKNIQEKLPDLSEKILDDVNDLNAYMVDRFQYFYAEGNQFDQAKFEIESEFTKQGIAYLRKQYKNQHFKEMQSFVEVALGDLYALYNTEYATKIQEVAWLNKLAHQKEHPIEGRLDNVYGGYMRDILYQTMQDELQHENQQ